VLSLSESWESQSRDEDVLSLSESWESQYRDEDDPGTIAFVFNCTYANVPVSGGESKSDRYKIIGNKD